MKKALPIDSKPLRRLIKNISIIALLVVLFPIGLALMLRSTWSKRAKLITTVLTLAWGVLLIWIIVFSPPSLKFADFDNRNTSITADSKLYELKGSVIPRTSKISINDKEISIKEDGSFSVLIPLPDTRNTVTVKAIDGDKSTVKSYTVTRPSDDELAKNADEEKRLVDLDVQRKKDLETAASTRIAQENAQKQTQLQIDLQKQADVQAKVQTDLQKKADEEKRLAAIEVQRKKEQQSAATIRAEQVITQNKAREQAEIQKKADEQKRLEASKASLTHKPEISSIEKTADGYVAKGYGPASKVIAIKINDSKNITAKVSKEGTYQLKMDKAVTPYGYMQLSLEKNGFLRKKYEDLQGKKYYSLLAASPVMSNKPMPAAVTKVNTEGSNYQVHGYYLPKTNVFIKKYDTSMKPVKTNKDGFFVVPGVQLANDGSSMSMYARYKKGLFGHNDVSISDNLYFNLADSTFTSAPKPKHSFKDFLAWFTAEQYSTTTAQSLGSNYAYYTSACTLLFSNYDSSWTSCMQEAFKKYLKPSTFADGSWKNDFTKMVDHLKSANNEITKYGTVLVDKQSEQYGRDMQEAEKIYDRLAVTN